MHKKNALDRRLSSLSDKELRELAESNRLLNIHLTNDFAFKKTLKGTSPEQIAALFDEDIQLVEELVEELSE